MGLRIESERLSLVPISDDYASEIFKEFSGDISKYMVPQPASKIEDTRQFIKGALERMNKGLEFQMVILDKKNKEFLGCIGIHNINTKTPSLGIWLKKSAFGKKYGKETIVTLVDWARNNLEFDYIIYPVDKDNIPSRKIPESLGADIAREYKEKNMAGIELNIVEYRIKK